MPGRGQERPTPLPLLLRRRRTYYDESTPLAGLKITDTNTKIKIVKEAKDGSTISLEVGPAVK
ncbi:hypothetical protein QQY66_18215 [Streptomyces sp. DG2A-72]|nr:hypothetical protein [Streptomyces sp. DG2A-72]MDO0933525.1 hypothetical protein [Streptomyces sp. DG2A-72]